MMKEDEIFQPPWLQRNPVKERVVMLIQMRTIVVKAGTSDLVVERFGKPGPIQEIEGFLDMSVMVKKGKRSDEEEEVVVMTRWESQEAWKRWETSDIHIQGHRENRGKPKPEHVIRTEHAMYEVKKVKGPIAVSSKAE
ncbi:antibiotic biosynthesis monooxygenase [Paenibacillus sp. J31TS4]|nr:antibiotic biosynthesis monooxygenase [Paenibacillus sp. J31TS4]